MRMTTALLLTLLSTSLVTGIALAKVLPEEGKTPGLLCSTSDPDFQKIDYAEQIARCKRHVSYEQKARLAHNYGDIPRTEWSNYEFDHLIPLCAGGSNDDTNVWPQPLGEAKDKDIVEDYVCTQMRAGTLKQAEAIQRMHEWFQENARYSFYASKAFEIFHRALIEMQLKSPASARTHHPMGTK